MSTDEAQTQQEIKEEAAQQPRDPQTRREALETELMEKGVSESGEQLGEPTD